MNTKEKTLKMLERLSSKNDIAMTDFLKETLSFDSLDRVNLLLEIEDVFDMLLEEEDMNPLSLHTAADVVFLVEKYKGENDEKN